MAVPTDFSGLSVWLQADAITGLVDGDPIAAWSDSSGLAHDVSQATTAKKPLYKTNILNGLPVVRFDGTDDCLVTAAFASPTAGTSVFAVINISTIDNFYRTVYTHAAAATWVSPFSRVLVRWQDNAGGHVWQNIVEDANLAANVVNSPSAATTGWQTIEFIYDQVNLQNYRNGAAFGSKARTGTLTSSTFPVYIGTDTALTECFIGDMAELVAYDNGLNATNRAAIEQYLTDKWFTAPPAPTVGFVPRRMPLGV